MIKRILNMLMPRVYRRSVRLYPNERSDALFAPVVWKPRDRWQLTEQKGMLSYRLQKLCNKC